MGYVRVVRDTVPGREYGGLIFRDENDQPFEVTVGTISEVNADQKKSLEENGFEVEDVSKAEFEKAQATPVATDVAGAAPVLGTPEATEDNDTSGSPKGEKSNK